MVAFDNRLKNNCVKTHVDSPATNNVTSPLNVAGGGGNESSTKILLTPLTHKNSQTRLLIKTDLSQPQKIGLNFNTNVKLKPKKTFDCKHLSNMLLLLIFTIYGVVSYLEIQSLKGEVHILKLKMELMVDLIDSDFKIINNVISDDKQESAENTLKEKNEVTKHSVMKREIEVVDEVERSCTNCSSNSRFARSVNRGPLAIHLRGALPEITVRDGGIIAPWYVDKSSSGNFLLAEAVVGERKGVLQVVEEGLYYIYAQVYYLTSSSLNSYAINVQLGEGRGREDSVVAVCSAEAATTRLSELSCFTATVRYLRRGDRLYVTQRERNRRIIFRDNHSFLGLVLLNAHSAVNNK